MKIEFIKKQNLNEFLISNEKLIIDTDDLDFVNDKEDLGSIIGLIEQRLYGLFN